MWWNVIQNTIAFRDDAHKQTYGASVPPVMGYGGNSGDLRSP
ncbi:hypothetical protein [Nodosilinea sp. P-1105]|nr:hypothetical protein [Nodosilinea sp. P-1105]